MISEAKTREEPRANVIDALDILLTPDQELASGAPAEGSKLVALLRDHGCRFHRRGSRHANRTDPKESL